MHIKFIGLKLLSVCFDYEICNYCSKSSIFLKISFQVRTIYKSFLQSKYKNSCDNVYLHITDH